MSTESLPVLVYHVSIDAKLEAYVSQPPSPKTETCSPELPSRRYCIPVLRGSSHAMLAGYSNCCSELNLIAWNTSKTPGHIVRYVCMLERVLNGQSFRRCIETRIFPCVAAARMPLTTLEHPHVTCRNDFNNRQLLGTAAMHGIRACIVVLHRTWCRFGKTLGITAACFRLSSAPLQNSKSGESSFYPGITPYTSHGRKSIADDIFWNVGG
jgi:hypothetical protein